MSRTSSPASSPTLSSPLASSSLSTPSSPSSTLHRLPRLRSRQRLTSLERITEEGQAEADVPVVERELLSSNIKRLRRSPSTPTLDRVKDQWEQSGTANGGTQAKRNWKPLSWNGRRGIVVGKEMKDSCGICFETAVKPNKTRCCGQLFCFQHLSDWLSAPESDGRCPTCRVTCSLEADTICLHPPTKIFTTRPNRRRSIGMMRPHRLGGASVQHNRSPSLDSPSSSSYESSSSSATSDSETSDTSAHRQTVVLEPRSLPHSLWESFLVHDFGRVLSLLGCALVLGALLS